MTTYNVHGSGTPTANGQALNSFLINTALQGGDIIILDANSEYLGPIQLPKLTLSSPVIIQSSSIASLTAGIRVQTSQRNLMPKITCQNVAANQAALWTADGASNWTLQGIEFRMTAFMATELFGLIWLGNNGQSGPYQNSQTLFSQMPSFIKFDRCSIWSGFPGADNNRDGQEIRHGVQMHGKSITFTECDIRDIKSRTADAQAMNNLNGVGPWFLINSYVEGSTENAIWGGGLPAMADPNNLFVYQPGSIVQYNWFRKATNWNPLSYDYDGSIWAVKNIFELKNANNAGFINGQGQTPPGQSSFLIDNNRFENSWQSVDQTGHAVLMTPRASPSSQGFSNDQIINITLTNNYFLHCQRWFEIFSTDSEPSLHITTGAGYPTTNITVKDNVVDDIWSWGNDVAPGYDTSQVIKSGNARNIWTLDLLTNYTGGTFILTYNDLTLFSGGAGHTGTPVTTGNINWNATVATLASNIQTALNALASVNGQAVCSGVGNVVTINFQYATFGNLTVNTSGLTGAGPMVLTPPHIGCGFVEPVITDTSSPLQNPGTNRVFRPAQLSSNGSGSSNRVFAIRTGDMLILDWSYRSTGGSYNQSWERVVVKSVTLDSGSPPNDESHNATGTFTCDTLKAHSGTSGGGVVIGVLDPQQSAPWTWYLDCGFQSTGGFGQTGFTTAYGQATPVNTLTNITIQHNTIKPYAGPGSATFGYAGVIGGAGAFNGGYCNPQSKHTGILINDNIFHLGSYMIKQGGDTSVVVGYGFRDSSGGTTNNGILQECDNTTQVKNNAFYALSSVNPPFNPTGTLFLPPAGLSYSGPDPNFYYADSTGPQFTNFAAGGAGLALTAGSPLKGKATDGTDVGSRNFTWYTNGNGPPQTQKATNTNVSASANPSITGNAVTWTASVTSTSSGTITGTVQFQLDGVNFGSAVTLSGGAATSISQTPTAGTHTITANYSGDSNFLASSGTLTQTVSNLISTTTTVTSSTNPSGVGVGVTWTASVVPAPGNSGTPTGTVQFQVDGTNFGSAVTLTSGSATSTSDSSLITGSHSIAGIYSGDSTYATSTGSLTQTVSNPTNTSTVAVVGNPNPSGSGQSVTWTATITGNITPLNKVDFETGDFSQCANHTGGDIVSSPTLAGTFCCRLVRNNSVANAEIRQSGSTYYSLPTAFYTFLFRYTGTIPSEAAVCNFLDTSSQYKGALHLDTQGRFLFYGHSALIGGPGTTKLQPDTTYTINAYYGVGSANAAWGLSINGTVELGGVAAVDLGTANNGAIEIGGNGGYTCTFYYDNIQMSGVSFPGPGGSPTGNIQFALDGTNFGSPIASFHGAATSISQTPSGGTHTVTAVYAGDSSFSGSTGTVLQSVASVQNTTTQLTAMPNPSKTGQSVTFTASVQPQTSGTPTGTVQFKDGGVNLGSAQTLASGVASLSTAALSIASHTITAVYSGDSNYSTSTSSALVQSVLALGPTTTTVSSSTTPSQPNVGVSWTATVSGTGGTPTGTVQFTVDGSNFGAAITLANGIATSGSNTSLAAGNHAITAVYSGDANFSASTGLFTQAVVAVQPVTPGGGGASIVLANAVVINSNGTGTVITNLKGFSDLLAQFQITAVPVGGSPTLDIYLQTSIDQGVTWIDMAHTQFKGNTATRFAQIVGDFTSSESIRSASDGQLVGERVIQGPWGDQLRLKWIFAAGGSSGSYTLSSGAFVKGSQGQN